MKKLRKHCQLKEQESPPEGVKKCDRFLQSNRHQVQKGDGEDTEGMKGKYEGIKSRYEHSCR